MEERLEKHREFLADRIDSEFGLLDKLLANRILTREAIHKIKLKDNTTEDKNRLLLDFILKNKKANELVSTLMDIGQTHLVNYLNADGDYRSEFGDDWPLRESEISRLEINRQSLIDILDTTDLCIRLFSDNVINLRQKQFICSKQANYEKNEALLDILTTFSVRQYKKTVACLNDSNQSHIADIFSEGGVIVRVHANFEGAVGNIDELEDKIITQFRKVLENRSLDEAIRLLDETKLGIIAARKGHSIVIYIHCRTHDELLQLIDLLKTDILKGIVERIFIELLSIGDTLRVSLTWSSEEFATAATHFETDDSLEALNDGTTSSKGGQKKSSLKISSVGKWLHKRFSKTKSEEAEDKQTRLRRLEDSNDSTLTGVLHSKPTFTNRPSFAAALDEESRHGDINQWRSIENTPRSMRSTRRVSSGLTSGHVKSRSSVPMLPYDSDELRPQSCRSTREELPQPERDKMKIAELKTELHREREMSVDLKKELSRLQESLREQRRICNELKDKLEIIQTERRATNLSIARSAEQSGAIKPENKSYYKDDPVLVKTITTKAVNEYGRGISGLAIADSELFVTSFKTQDVEVYDLKNLSLARTWRLDHLINPWDLGYCNSNKCLYVMDATCVDTSKEIVRVTLNGKLLKRWTTRMGYGSISATYDSNVVMAGFQGYIVTEYTAEGQIVREITLSAKAGLARPWHALKLTNGRLLICHGEEVDSLHRVCEVDTSGHIRKSFGGSGGSTPDRLLVPMCLAVDSSGGVIVADRDNSRVLALSSDLEFTREIISSGKDGMHRPERLAIDQANGRLLVVHNDAYWSKCLVLVYKII